MEPGQNAQRLVVEEPRQGPELALTLPLLTGELVVVMMILKHRIAILMLVQVDTGEISPKIEGHISWVTLEFWEL